MREIRTSGSMSGEGKRDVAEWPKSPRLSSTLPLRCSQNEQVPACSMSSLKASACRKVIPGGLMMV